MNLYQRNHQETGMLFCLQDLQFQTILTGHKIVRVHHRILQNKLRNKWEMVLTCDWWIDINQILFRRKNCLNLFYKVEDVSQLKLSL